MVSSGSEKNKGRQLPFSCLLYTSQGNLYSGGGRKWLVSRLYLSALTVTVDKRCNIIAVATRAEHWTLGGSLSSGLTGDKGETELVMIELSSREAPKSDMHGVGRLYKSRWPGHSHVRNTL